MPISIVTSIPSNTFVVCYIELGRSGLESRMRFGRRGLAVAIVGWVLTGGIASAAELVMFERAGCRWCAEWDRVIGPIYPKTDVGRLAPLRRLRDDDPQSAGLRLARPIRYTPTFVLTDDAGVEVGRLEGYPGEDSFWFQVERLAARLADPSKVK